MTTNAADTNLSLSGGTTATIPTLSAAVTCNGSTDCDEFQSNFWGYSVNEINLESSTIASGTQYSPLVDNTQAPITILKSKGVGQTDNDDAKTEDDIFFGAKFGSDKPAGTYKGTVLFTVTSDTSGNDLPASGGTSTPPAEEGPGFDDPGTDGPSYEPWSPPTTDNEPSIDPSVTPSEQPSTGNPADTPSSTPSESPSGSTNTPSTSNPGQSSTGSGSNTYAYVTDDTYTYHSSSETTDSGENEKKHSTADDFISPLGVTEKTDPSSTAGTTTTTTNVQHGSVVTTILMIVAFLAAGIGIFFFILAKRRDKEDEDGDEIQQV